jgi:Flp pilus assembly protein CpaB
VSVAEPVVEARPDRAEWSGRRRGRRLGARWTPSHLWPVLFALLAAVVVVMALQDRSATVWVAVANGSIPPGSAITAADTRLVKAHRGDGALLAGLISVRAVGSSSLVAATEIDSGDPITASVVTPAGAAGGMGSMSIPVGVDQAAGGGIGPGDRVDVIVASAGSASYVAQGLTVLSVAPSRTTGVLADGSSTGFWVVVAVDRSEALRVAAAIGDSSSAGQGGIMVVRAGAQAPASAQSSFSLPGANAGNSPASAGGGQRG